MATADSGLGDLWWRRALVLLGTGAALAGFSPVVQGRSWWFSAMVTALAVCLAGAVLRTLGLRRSTPIATTAVAVLAIGWVFVPATLWIVLPTPDSWRTLVDLSDEAWLVIAEQPPPVENSSALALVLALAAVVVAVLADAVVDRRHGPIAVGGLWTALLVVPSAVLGELPSIGWFALVAVPWLALLASARSVAGPGAWRRPAAVLVAGAAVGASAVGPTVLPDVSAVAAPFGGSSAPVFGAGINPMVELGNNLRRGEPVTVLEYTTTLQAAPYLKVATLREFGGRSWSPVEAGPLDPPEGEPALADDIARSVETTEIDVVALRTSMLPVPYPVLTVDGLDGEWEISRAGLTVQSESDDSRGQRYEVRSLDVDPQAEQLRAAPPPDLMDLRAFVQLPQRRPAVLARTAASVTAGAGNDYDRAIALQDFLRGPDFSYSEKAPIDEGFDGNGLQALEQFLARKAGYCVHFSSAMAVMARELGMPARIAVGYAPGTANGTRDGESLYTVSSHDLHAWTEIWFEGTGWVAFEPTPGIGRATRFAEPVGATDPAAAAPLPEATAGPDLDVVEQQAAAAEQDTPAPVGRSLAALAAVVVIGLVPAVARLVRRSRRLGGGAVAAWGELLDTAVDLGIEVPTAATPRQQASALAGRLGGTRPVVLEALRDAVEVAWFAPPTSASAAPTGLRDVLADLRRSVSRPARLRALLLPRSLVSRGRAASSRHSGPARSARSASG